MLVAQHDLQEEDLLAVSLKPEMAGLDDAGMHRADRDLVHLMPGNLEEIVPLPVERGGRPRRGPVVGGMAPNRLEPGMAHRYHAALLGDLPLEQVRLRAVG